MLTTENKLKLICDVLKIITYGSSEFDFINIPISILRSKTASVLSTDELTKVLARLDIHKNCNVLFSYTGFWYISRNQNLKYVHGEDVYEELEERLFVDSLTGKYEITYKDLKYIYDIWEIVRANYSIRN